MVENNSKVNQTVVSIIGKSGSGKTTLIEKLIRGLKEVGIRVVAIKHSPSEFESDLPGNDSYRYFSAGADISLISSEKKILFSKRMQKELTVVELCREYLGGADIIIAEGFKGEKLLKIEVFRENYSDELCAGVEELLLLVSESEKIRSGFMDRVSTAHPEQIDEIIADIVFYIAMNKKSVFVGVGHQMRGDDSFGIDVIEKIRKHTSCLCVNAGMSPENHIGKIVNRAPEIILIFDTAIISNSARPGQFKVFGAPELSDFAFSTHGTGIKMFSLYLKENTAAKIFIIGVQPGGLSIMDDVSEGVRKAVNNFELLAKKVSINRGNC